MRDETPDTSTTTGSAADKERRIEGFRRSVEELLEDTRADWQDNPDPAVLAALVVDALGDQAAELLADGTMLKSMRTENGQIVLETKPARELLLTWVAVLRTQLGDAENYAETPVSFPKLSVDVKDGQQLWDDYTLTIQRRYRPTPHELRERAEDALARANAEIQRLRDRVVELEAATGAGAGQPQ